MIVMIYSGYLFRLFKDKVQMYEEEKENVLIEIPFFNFEFLINRLTLIDLFNLSTEDLVANR